MNSGRKMKPKSKSRGVRPANQNELDLQFSRCLGSLRLIAARVLNGDDDVREAMRRSYLAAASQRRRLESDGEFRQWLVRTVLNEALMILHEKESGGESLGHRISDKSADGGKRNCWKAHPAPEDELAGIGHVNRWWRVCYASLDARHRRRPIGR